MQKILVYLKIERVFTVSIRGDINKEFIFPKEMPLEIKLKDILEKEVEEKYYINTERAKKLISEYKSEEIGVGYGIRSREFAKQGWVVISPTLAARDYKDPKNIIEPKDNCVIVREATKKGYAIAKEGDSINLEQPNSKTRRGRVGHGVAQTLTTSCNQATLDNYRIRKITPKECWRLMGFSDESFEKAAKVCSNTQLYKQAGNSIVVNVLVEILKNLLF